ncbi:MAG: hypothetical protein R3A78_05690 [Polyangiales bacterium]
MAEPSAEGGDDEAAKAANADSAPKLGASRRTDEASSSAGAATASANAASAKPTEDESTSTASAAAVVEAPKPTGEPTAGSSAIDDVLDNALGGKPAQGGVRTVPGAQAVAPAAPASDNSNLPNTPEQAEVSKTLSALMPALRQCAADQQGLATAMILVKNDGSVGSVSVGGFPFGGTPQGSCMEAVLKKASFKPFKQTTFSIRYPFAIR